MSGSCHMHSTCWNCRRSWNLSILFNFQLNRNQISKNTNHSYWSQLFSAENWKKTKIPCSMTISSLRIWHEPDISKIYETCSTWTWAGWPEGCTQVSWHMSSPRMPWMYRWIQDNPPKKNAICSIKYLEIWQKRINVGPWLINGILLP